MRVLWGAALAFFLVAQAGGIALHWRYAAQGEPRFAALGLATVVAAGDNAFDIAPADPAHRAWGLPDIGTLTAIDGRPVASDLDEWPVSQRLAGSAGQAVTLTVLAADGRHAIVHTIRTPVRPGPGWAFFLSLALGLATVATVTVSAALLMLRRPEDPVALLLAFALAAIIGFARYPYAFYDWIGAPDLGDVVGSIWLGLLTAALPAFPDGRFVPRWGGWLAAAAIPVAILTSLENISEAFNAVGIVAAAAAVLTVLVRFRRTPAGLARQQLKWAACGFAASVTLLVLVGLLFMALESGLVPETWRGGLATVAAAAMEASLMLLPLGVLIAMLRLRLWDADAAIGRSATFAVVTLLTGGAWAASSTILNQLVESSLGGAGKPIVAAVSTLCAAVTLGPARSVAGDWMERRFRAGILALRALPAKLQLWQHGDTAEAIGARVAAAVADALHADRAAVLLHSGEGYRAIALVGLSADELTAWRARQDDDALGRDVPARSDPLLPTRIALDDEGVPIGVLLLGPRSDGSAYARDERDALADLEPPLAATLRQAQRRAARDREAGDRIAAMSARIAALEDLKLR